MGEWAGPLSHFIIPLWYLCILLIIRCRRTILIPISVITTIGLRNIALQHPIGIAASIEARL